MSFGSNVAPRRRVRPKPEPWYCACNVDFVDAPPNPGYLVRCPDCGRERP